MDDYRISDLTETNVINNTDILHLRNNSGIDKKIQYSNIKSNLINRGLIYIYLTQDTPPKIGLNSYVEITGIKVKFDSDTSIPGSATSNAINYIICDSSKNLAWTIIEPILNEVKNGLYNADGTKRYIGEVYYDGTNYSDGYGYSNINKLDYNIDNSKGLALDTVTMPKFIGDAYTNVLSDPCDLTTANWTKDGVVVEATEYTINGHKLWKITQINSGGNRVYQGGFTGSTDYSFHIILRDETLQITDAHVWVELAESPYLTITGCRINFQNQIVSVSNGALKYNWLDRSTVEIFGTNNTADSGSNYNLFIRPSDSGTDKIIYVVEPQLVQQELLLSFVDGTHVKDDISKDFAMPSQFTFDMIIEPRFLYDNGGYPYFIVWYLDIDHVWALRYHGGLKKIYISYNDGGTQRYLFSQQFDDGSSYININQRIRIIGSMNLSSGGRYDSRLIVIPLESGSIYESANWDGAPDVKSSTFPTLQIGQQTGVALANSDFEYIRFYDGLLVGDINNNEDAEYLLSKKTKIYEVLQVDDMNNRNIDKNVSLTKTVQRLINDIRIGTAIQNKAIKPRHLDYPVGLIWQYDGANWIDDSTMPGWYACIAENINKGCPDMVNKFAMGKVVIGSGAIGGSNTHTISSAELPIHTHTINHDHASFTSGSGGVDHTHAIDHDHANFNSGTQSANHTHNTVMGSHNHAAYFHHGGTDENSYSIDIEVYADGSSVTGPGYTESTNLGTKTSGSNSASHTHSINVPAFTGNSGNASSYSHTHSINVPAFTGNSGNGDFANNSFDNRPAYYSMLFIRNCA